MNWHIFWCALTLLDKPEDQHQGLIIEYIIKHEREVPLFMLNDVPTFLTGYKAGLNNE